MKGTARRSTAAARPRPTRERAMPAGSAIASALEQRGLTDKIRALDIVTSWNAIVGPRLANRAWPDGLTNRVLWIRVASSAWLHELTLIGPKLKAIITEHVGAPALFDSVRLHLGGRPKEADDLIAEVRARAPARPQPRPVPQPATGEAAAAIEAETSAIADDDLRELVRRVRIANNR